MKNILFLIGTLGGGGAEKVLVDLVNNLNRKKYNITVQTIIDEGVHKANLKEHIQYKTCFSFKNEFLKKVFVKYILKKISAKLLYKRYVKNSYDFEVAFLEGLPTKIVAASSNKTSKKISWVHIDLINFPNSEKIYNHVFSEADAYKCFDSVICVSEAVKNAFITKYGIHNYDVKTIYNILDDEHILNMGREPIEEIMPHPCFISVGRLTEQKGYDILLRVHKRLMDEGLDHYLWIIGDGPDKEKLLNFIDQNNLNHVRLMGYKENPYKYISKSDLFVSSSRAEGYSTVITEAVILGVPVISTDTAGSREPIYCPRCSLIVDNNENALYIGIKSVLCDPNKLTILKEDVKEKGKHFKKLDLLKELEEYIDSI